MKTQNEDDYQRLVQDLRGDGEKGTLFQKFLEAWADSAEEIMDSRPVTPVEAIRLALEPTEIIHGEVPVAFLGQMLLVLLGHWAYATELASGLTIIEMALVGECLDAKLISLENSAKADYTPSGE